MPPNRTICIAGLLVVVVVVGMARQTLLRLRLRLPASHLIEGPRDRLRCVRVCAHVRARVVMARMATAQGRAGRRGCPSERKVLTLLHALARTTGAS